MIRIICVESDISAAANVGGSAAHVSYRSFEVEAPELEAWLAEAGGHGWRYIIRSVVGVETQPVPPVTAPAINADDLPFE